VAQKRLKLHIKDKKGEAKTAKNKQDQYISAHSDAVIQDYKYSLASAHIPQFKKTESYAKRHTKNSTDEKLLSCIEYFSEEPILQLWMQKINQSRY